MKTPDGWVQNILDTVCENDPHRMLSYLVNSAPGVKKALSGFKADDSVLVTDSTVEHGQYPDRQLHKEVHVGFMCDGSSYFKDAAIHEPTTAVPRLVLGQDGPVMDPGVASAGKLNDRSKNRVKNIKPKVTEMAKAKFGKFDYIELTDDENYEVGMVELEKQLIRYVGTERGQQCNAMLVSLALGDDFMQGRSGPAGGKHTFMSPNLGAFEGRCRRIGALLQRYEAAGIIFTWNANAIWMEPGETDNRDIVRNYQIMEIHDPKLPHHENPWSEAPKL